MFCQASAESAVCWCRGNVEKVIDGKDQRGAKDQLLKDLDLIQVLDRDVENLSGKRPAYKSLVKSCIAPSHL